LFKKAFRRDNQLSHEGRCQPKADGRGVPPPPTEQNSLPRGEGVSRRLTEEGLPGNPEGIAPLVKGGCHGFAVTGGFLHRLPPSKTAFPEGKVSAEG